MSKVFAICVQRNTKACPFSPKELQDLLDELEASRKRAWDQPLTLRVPSARTLSWS
jgi:hypothetical protein